MRKNNGKPKTLAGGVRVASVSHPRYAWRLTYFTGEAEGRKRRQKFYHTKNEAIEDATRVSVELRMAGDSDHEITKTERRAVMEFREMTAELPDAINEPSLSEAVALMRDTLRVRDKSKTVREVVDRYLLTLQRKKVSEGYQYTVRHRLEKFVTDYGDWLACDISQEIAGEWLGDLVCALTSFNHFRAALAQCFNCAVDMGTVETNPVAKIAKKKTGASKIGILTVEKVKGSLENASDEILPGLALGLFAGVRRAELGRMGWREIDFEQGHVEITAAKSKTAARRLIPMRDVLRHHLEPYRQKSGLVMPSEMIWRKHLKAAPNAAGITAWPHNDLRHSFASYHLAHFKDAAALALEMDHESTRMIFEHYRVLLLIQQGREHWMI